MNKRLIQGFVSLIVILFCVSLISSANEKEYLEKEVADFEESVSKNEEVDNGVLGEVVVIEEDSSNLISDVNSRVASFIVKGLNSVLNLGLKLIEGIAN